MGGFRSADRFELLIDSAAATVFAAAVHFLLSGVLPAAGAAGAAIGSCLAAGLTFRVLRGGSSADIFSICFTPADLAFEDAESESLDELLLTADLAVQAAAEELLLEDELQSVAPDSRVVRLFDPARLPTPGELHQTIERHLRFRGAPHPVDDASEALSDALAELRRSLR